MAREVRIQLKSEAFLVIKNRADHDRILVNDIRVRLLNLDQITFG